MNTRLNAVAAANPEILDINKNLSYGVQRSATNMIDERPKADEVAFEIANRTNDSQFIVISSLFADDNNKTIFTDVAEMLAAVVPGVAANRVHALQDGEIWKDAVTPALVLTAQSKSAGFDINRFLRYIGMCPTRLTKARLKSVTTANVAETGNFDNNIKNLFFSPFGQPQENFLSLGPLIQTQNNFSPNILDVDFIDQAFPMILSNEHFTAIQVNAGTILTLNLFVGAQDSPAQRHWRKMRKADDIIRENGIGK